MASYCAIPRDYLSDTPLLRVFGVSTWPIRCDTPSPFSECLPLGGKRAKWRCDPPPTQTGISAILARYPMKTRQKRAIRPSAILSRKGLARYGGDISRWAAKCWRENCHVYLEPFDSTVASLPFSGAKSGGASFRVANSVELFSK